MIRNILDCHVFVLLTSQARNGEMNVIWRVFFVPITQEHFFSVYRMRESLDRLLFWILDGSLWQIFLHQQWIQNLLHIFLVCFLWWCIRWLLLLQDFYCKFFWELTDICYWFGVERVFWYRLALLRKRLQIFLLHRLRWGFFLSFGYEVG